MIIIYKFVGKDRKTYEIESIKENSNCPASEKNGEGPGSCGGNTSNSDGQKISNKSPTTEHPKEFKQFLDCKEIKSQAERDEKKLRAKVPSGSQLFREKLRGIQARWQQADKYERELKAKYNF